MHREIKFRGKLKSNPNVWAYGHFTTDQHGKFYIVQLNADPKDKTYPFYEVDMNTISQYIGLKDKNNNEIYEGDIVESNYGVDQLIYENGGFAPFSVAGWESTPKWSDCEIIGNIYEKSIKRLEAEQSQLKLF